MIRVRGGYIIGKDCRISGMERARKTRAEDIRRRAPHGTKPNTTIRMIFLRSGYFSPFVLSPFFSLVAKRTGCAFDGDPAVGQGSPQRGGPGLCGDAFCVLEDLDVHLHGRGDGGQLGEEGDGAVHERGEELVGDEPVEGGAFVGRC